MLRFSAVKTSGPLEKACELSGDRVTAMQGDAGDRRPGHRAAVGVADERPVLEQQDRGPAGARELLRALADDLHHRRQVETGGSDCALRIHDPTQAVGESTLHSPFIVFSGPRLKDSPASRAGRDRARPTG